MSPPLMNRDQEVQRFILEARNAARVQGDHVVRVFDVAALDDGTPYIVMEYLEGEDLRQLLDRRGPLPVPEAVDYVLQAGEAIAEAHMAGIVHRDLEPGNLFCCTQSDGSSLVKVLDFGVSKLLQRADRTLRPSVLTGPYIVGGSPLYSAPEQFHAPTGGDARVDIWALGAIVYELVCGRTPFSGETVAEILSNVANATQLPMHMLRPDVPAQLDAAVARALAKEPTARPATVAEFARALAPFADRRSLVSLERIEAIFRDAGKPPVDRARVALPPRPNLPWRPGAPGLVAMAAIVAGTLLGSAYLATHSERGGGELRAHAVVIPQPMPTARPEGRREARAAELGSPDDVAGSEFTAPSPSSDRQQAPEPSPPAPPRSAVHFASPKPLARPPARPPDTTGFGGLL
jgi:serine/threonine-protein kinase